MQRVRLPPALQTTTSYAMRTLHIDIETYCALDLASCGVHRYVQDPSFRVLLLAYAWGDDPVTVLDFTCFPPPFPSLLFSQLTDPDVRKVAHNAPFEITCLQAFLGEEMDPAQWSCTMVGSLRMGYPASLAECARAMGLQERKDPVGSKLIHKFSKPGPKGAPRYPGAVASVKSKDAVKDAEDWCAFKAYCAQDVEVERAIRKRLEAMGWRDEGAERDLWVLDRRINDRGVAVDTALVANAIALAETDKSSTLAEGASLTGLANPGSVTQFKGWLEIKLGRRLSSVDKASVQELLDGDLSDEVRRALHLRASLTRSSVAKYKAMEAAASPIDHRVRGLFQFHGARTGRWAGRLVQVQNLPQGNVHDIDEARVCLLRAPEMVSPLWGDAQSVLSSLIRTAFVPSPGCRFIVADFSAIEARVLAWLAGESWRMEVFRTHGKIYEASASQMFNVPMEEITKGSVWRKKGKVAELALGYGGGAGALERMGGSAMGLDTGEMRHIVRAWRDANPSVVAFWCALENAAMSAVRSYPAAAGRWIKSGRNGADMLLRLPSGRELRYPAAQIKPNASGRDTLYFKSNDTTRTEGGYAVWGPGETYGGRLVENVTQAVARDCLAVAMQRLEGAGYPIVMHIHDEVVLDVPEGRGSLEEVLDIMARPIDWAPGLPLKAAGFESMYYKKD